MLTNDSIEQISKIFCGDIEDLYTNKSGSKLVSFFNQYLSSADWYGQGFPTRWKYVHDKIVNLYNAGKIGAFFDVILSIHYLEKEQGLSEVDAILKKDTILTEINAILKTDQEILVFKNNHYILENINDDLVPLGHGGYANAYYQKSTGLVIKKLKEDCIKDASIRSRFKREFEITKSLADTEAVIPVYNYNASDCSYTMLKAEQTYENYITANSLDDASKITCIRQILYTMKEVHSRNILHRDLSPNNIFIYHGRLLLADFGLGKDLNILHSHQTLLTNQVGQFLYCAPEQFMLLKESSKRSDVYSLGRIINFTMTGNPQNYSHNFRNVCQKATNENSAIRYSDAGELLKAFEKSIEYHTKEHRLIDISRKIENNIFDDELEEYIFEQSSEALCKHLLKDGRPFGNSLFVFMKIDDKHAEHIMLNIRSTYEQICHNWDDYDIFSWFTNSVLNAPYSYVVKEMAARTLHEIAYDKNRFNAQNLIASLIEEGIEPALEDILQQ